MHTTARHPRRRDAICLATLLSTAFAGSAAGQSASFGADIVSRYVWRGIDFGESVSVQPSLTLGAGGLEAGAWASYSISASGAGANENDLWVTYTVAASSGASFSAGLTDYYFPAPDSDLGFRHTDAHTLEWSLAFSGPESFPVSLFAGLVADDDKPMYLEAGLPLALVDDVELGVHAGMVTTASSFYGTEGAALINLGITAAKALEITDSFALPTSVSYIYNPDQDRAFLVFGLSLAP